MNRPHDPRPRPPIGPNDTPELPGPPRPPTDPVRERDADDPPVRLPNPGPVPTHEPKLRLE